MRTRVLIGGAVLIGAFSLVGATGALDDADGRLERDPAARVAAGEVAQPEAQGLLTRLTHAVTEDSPEPQKLRLTVPEGAGLAIDPTPYAPAEPPPGALRAHAYQYVSRVFDRPRSGANAVGFVRRGIVLTASERVPGRGCKGGAWYELVGGGYVCSRDGFAISENVRDVDVRQPAPKVERALPYGYGKAEEGALRYYRIPTAEEEAEIARAVEAEQRLPDVVERKMDGVFLLGLDRLEGEGERAFYRTVRGRYVRASDVEPKPEPAMRGELLGEQRQLPLAFVHGQQGAPLYRMQGGQRVQVGVAEHHARFAIVEETTWGGERMLVGEGGVGVPEKDVRIVTQRTRPQDVGPNEKWIHVNLAQQALVAYEGDDPVFATLVSSGLEPDFATPTGLFRVREKHISTTMNGPDPDNGYYEVEEVPWTMFYYDSFALHGAYWHDTFGNTKSHGCTNISPADARWLFYWSDDPVPPGWTAVRKIEGTWVYITRDDSA
jgi:hypothetical protein